MKLLLFKASEDKIKVIFFVTSILFSIDIEPFRYQCSNATLIAKRTN